MRAAFLTDPGLTLTLIPLARLPDARVSVQRALYSV
jgi:hypothetical protein